MPITNEFIYQTLPTAKQYCLFILKSGPVRNQPDADQIQWEHVRYLSVTCPIMDESNIMGVGVLNTTDIEEAKSLLDKDPNVKAGRLGYDGLK